MFCKVFLNAHTHALKVRALEFLKKLRNTSAYNYFRYYTAMSKKCGEKMI